MPGTLPSSSTKPACSPTEMTVPMVSKKSVSMMAKISSSSAGREDLRDRHAAAFDRLERREERAEVRRARRPPSGSFVTPSSSAATVATRMPQRMSPLMRSAMNARIASRPMTATHTYGCVKSPRPTSVVGVRAR